MELSYKEEVGVGALVLIGLVAFTAGMFWLTGRSISSKGVSVAVVFKSVSGLREGDPVRVSGVKKGRVGGVRLERVGKVVVTLQLDPEVRPHKDATAAVASADFLGAKYIDYDPGTTSELLAAGETIAGVTEEQFADVASRAATSATELIGNAKGIVTDRLGTDIHNTLVATQHGMAALSEATNGPIAKQTTRTLEEVTHVMARLDTLLGATTVATTGKRIDTLTVNLSKLTGQLATATGSLKDLLQKMDSGQGTLGRMATDTTLYKNLNEMLQSLTKLMTDLRERPGRYLTVKVF